MGLMKNASRRMKGLAILIAGVAVLCAGAVKWKQYTRLRERIAGYAREEKVLLDAYRERSRIRHRCGNELAMLEAYRAVAAERRRQIEECERAIWRLW